MARRWGRSAGERYAERCRAGERPDYWKFRDEQRQKWLAAEFDGGEPPPGSVDGTKVGDGLYHTYNIAYEVAARGLPEVS